MEWADMKTSPWEWDNRVLFYGNNCKIKEEHAAVNHHEASGPRNGKSSCDDLRGTRTAARSDANHGLEQHQKPTENDGDVVTVAVAAGSADSVIGLKLGKRTYFEDTGGVKPISSTPVPISSTPVPAKKQRSLMQPNQIPHCQVEGCKADLTLAKDYHRRHKVCEMHSKSAKVTVAAIEQRFCQQCSRFHVLSEFDEGKRSCRRRLDGHNKRRRKPQPDAMALNHSRFSSTFYEDRRLGSILMDRSSFLHPRIASGSVLADPIDFKLGHGKGTWPRVVKVEDQLPVDGELHLSASDRQPYESALTRHNAEKLLLFLQSSKTAPGEVLNQGIHQYVPSSGGHVDQALTLSSSSRTGLSGIDVASATHGLSGVSDSGCALSLLSSQSWSSSAPGTASFDIATQGITMDQLIHDDQHLMAQPLVQGVQHNFADKLLTLRSQSSTSLIPNGFTSAAVNSISKEQHGEPIVSTLNGIGNFEGHVFGLMQGNNFSGSQAVNSRDIQCTIDLMCRSTQAQTDDCQSQPGIGNQGSRQFTNFQSLRSYESSIYDSQQML